MDERGLDRLRRVVHEQSELIAAGPARRYLVVRDAIEVARQVALHVVLERGLVDDGKLPQSLERLEPLDHRPEPVVRGDLVGDELQRLTQLGFLVREHAFARRRFERAVSGHDGAVLASGYP